MKIKELRWLKILAYPGMLFIFGIIYILLPYLTWLSLPNDARQSGSVLSVLGFGSVVWMVLVFVLGALGIYGLYLLVRLLGRIEDGNIFTRDNAAALRKMDKVVLWGLYVALALDLTLVLLLNFEITLFLFGMMFTLFLLIGHLILKPLAEVVDRSAELQEDLDLTV